MIRKISSLVAMLAIMLTFVGFFGIAKVDATEYTDTIDCPKGTIVSDTMTFETDCFTIVHAKGTGTNFAAYTPWRVYGSNTVTITASDALVSSITKVEIVHSTTYYGTLSSTAGTVTMATTSGGTTTIDNIAAGTKELTITNTAAGQSRWAKVTITYEKADVTSEEEFALLSLGKKMSFDYHWSSTETFLADQEVSFIGATNGATYNSSGLEFVDKQCDITKLTSIDGTKFQAIYKQSETATNYYIKDGEIRIYNGFSLIINALGDNYIKSVTLPADATTNATATVAEDGKSATISATGIVKFTSAIVMKCDVVDVEYEYTVEQAAVYCRYGVSKELYDAIISADSNATFGFQIGSNNYACEATYDATEEVYYFACIVEEIPAASFDFTMTFKGYVTINGTTTYTTDVQSFSVKSLATTYLTDYATDSTVQAAKGVLTYLSTYGE